MVVRLLDFMQRVAERHEKVLSRRDMIDHRIPKDDNKISRSDCTCSGHGVIVKTNLKS